MKKHSTSGFTLIEVMIVVAIIAIISTFAVPGYQEYMMRSRLQDAISQMAGKQVQLEQWFQDRRTYNGSPACANDTSNRNFDFSCNGTETAGGGLTFTLTATGKGSVASFSFTVNQANVRSTVSVPTEWQLPTPNNCWVVRKGGHCS